MTMSSIESKNQHGENGDDDEIEKKYDFVSKDTNHGARLYLDNIRPLIEVGRSKVSVPSLSGYQRAFDMLAGSSSFISLLLMRLCVSHENPEMDMRVAWTGRLF